MVKTFASNTNSVPVTSEADLKDFGMPKSKVGAVNKIIQMQNTRLEAIGR